MWVLRPTYGSFYFCRTNISAALPGIEAEFGYSKARIGWRSRVTRRTGSVDGSQANGDQVLARRVSKDEL